LSRSWLSHRTEVRREYFHRLTPPFCRVKSLLKQAKEAVRIARTSFKFGEACLLAQRLLWQTFQAYAQARIELSVALTELERLVGKEL